MGSRDHTFSTDQKQYIANRLAEKVSEEDIAAELGCSSTQIFGVKPQLPPADPGYVFVQPGEAEGYTPEEEGFTTGDTGGDTGGDPTGDTPVTDTPVIRPETAKPVPPKPPKKTPKGGGVPYSGTPQRPNAILDTAEAAGRVIGMAGDLADRQSLTAEKIMEIRDDADQRASEKHGHRAEVTGAERGTLIDFIKEDRTYERERAANEKKAIEEKHAAELAKHQADLGAKLKSERSFVETIQNLYKEKDTEIAKIREGSLKERHDYLDKKEALIDSQAEAATANAKAEVEKAEELAATRLNFTEKHIGLLNEHAKTVRDMAKEQGETQLEKLAELAIERIGDPIVKAVTKQTGNETGMALAGAAPKKTMSRVEESKGDNNVGLFGGIGKGVFKKIIAKYPDELRKVGDKLTYYIEKWPRLPIGLAVDMLWSWRNDPTIGHYVQTGIAWLMGEELSSLVELIGASFTAEAKKACSTEDAKKWWTMFQDQLIERYEDEERQAKFFRQEQEAEEAKAREPAADKG